MAMMVIPYDQATRDPLPSLLPPSLPQALVPPLLPRYLLY